MRELYVAFLQRFESKLPEIKALFGDEWSRVWAKILSRAGDSPTDAHLGDAIVSTLSSGPAARLVSDLLADAMKALGPENYAPHAPHAPRRGFDPDVGNRDSNELMVRQAHAIPDGVTAKRTLDLLKSTTPADAAARREITVTAHTLDGAPIATIPRAETGKLRFRVDAPTAGNLAVGDTGIEGIPEGGLLTRWVVTSSTVQFVPEISEFKVERIGETWRAQFDLRIPESGRSDSYDLGVIGAPAGSTLLLSLYTLLDDGPRELYREVTIKLTAGPQVVEDQISKSPQYTHLNTTHEWTTPGEHIQVSFTNRLIEVSTKRFLTQTYDFVEASSAGAATLDGPIRNVRAALETFREKYDAYLDDLDSADMLYHLDHIPWQPYEYDGTWTVADGADDAHKAAFAQIEQDDVEWRALASNGYTLFDNCFPKGTQIRAALENLLPGSRIDFHWTSQSDAGFVSHVPWALMYLEPVSLDGPIHPEKFFGLRFRIGSRSWRVTNSSVVLGGLDAASAMNILYWARQDGDDVGVEADWQSRELDSARTGVRITQLPDATAPDLKKQIQRALESPTPSPVALLYFYCHCAVGDGSQPILRFGGSSKVQDVIRHTEISQLALADAPLIFANACSTAQADPHMTSLLEERFFARGARAFIGTETKVPVKLASKFAWLFFQFLYRRADPDRKPMAAGEALTQARLFLWTQYRNIGGLFYSISNQYDLYLASQKEVIALRKDAP
jgi:hypothetical protein